MLISDIGSRKPRAPTIAAASGLRADWRSQVRCPFQWGGHTRCGLLVFSLHAMSPSRSRRHVSRRSRTHTRASDAHRRSRPAGTRARSGSPNPHERPSRTGACSPRTPWPQPATARFFRGFTPMRSKRADASEKMAGTFPENALFWRVDSLRRGGNRSDQEISCHLSSRSPIRCSICLQHNPNSFFSQRRSLPKSSAPTTRAGSI